MEKAKLLELLLKLADTAQTTFAIKDDELGMPLWCHCDTNERIVGCWTGGEVTLSMVDPDITIRSMNPEDKSVTIQLPVCIHGGNGHTELRINSYRYSCLNKSTEGRFPMALYNLLNRLFDGKVRLDLVSFNLYHEERFPKEWAEREKFGDLPHMEDLKLQDDLLTERLITVD